MIGRNRKRHITSPKTLFSKTGYSKSHLNSSFKTHFLFIKRDIIKAEFLCLKKYDNQLIMLWWLLKIYFLKSTLVKILVNPRFTIQLLDEKFKDTFLKNKVWGLKCRMRFTSLSYLLENWGSKLFIGNWIGKEGSTADQQWTISSNIKYS